MDPLLLIFVSCMALGMLTGTLAGMLGIGGGLIIVPVLSALLTGIAGISHELAMPMAIATSSLTAPNSSILFNGTCTSLFLASLLYVTNPQSKTFEEPGTEVNKAERRPPVQDSIVVSLFDLDLQSSISSEA